LALSEALIWFTNAVEGDEADRVRRRAAFEQLGHLQHHRHARRVVVRSRAAGRGVVVGADDDLAAGAAALHRHHVLGVDGIAVVVHGGEWERFWLIAVPLEGARDVCGALPLPVGALDA
jgi:RNase P/RNase MRP subunit POP5